MKSLKEYMTTTNEAMESDEVMAIMSKHPEEVAKMKQMGDIDSRSDLYMELYNYYSDEMPYGTQKARDGDPTEWIMTRLDDLGLVESQEVNEDSVDSMKQAKLNDIFMALEQLNNEYDELDQMDRDENSSGIGDLTDQLTTMRKHIQGLYMVLDRAGKVVPQESKEPTGSNPNMEGSRMGNMHIQNLRKNAGLDLDPVKN
tara:strand:- start:41 stop:640 length:600 start_codon:yes stop_codon:yes gene_type:complete